MSIWERKNQLLYRLSGCFVEIIRVLGRNNLVRFRSALNLFDDGHYIVNVDLYSVG